MRCVREEICGGRMAILTFVREEGDKTLDDAAVNEAMTGEKLRPVTEQSDFHDFCRAKGYTTGSKNKPRVPVVMFGNHVRGPAASGSFQGYRYMDTDGQIKVVEHWTRGSTGDQWGDDHQFLFVAV
jgi:hypothetical protein